MALSEKAARSKDLNFTPPKLQHRHFAFIAHCIREIPSPSARVEATAIFFRELERTNPAFDGDRFNDACNVQYDQYTMSEVERAIVYAVFWLEHLKTERFKRLENVE